MTAYFAQKSANKLNMFKLVHFNSRQQKTTLPELSLVECVHATVQKAEVNMEPKRAADFKTPLSLQTMKRRVAVPELRG